MFRFAIVLTLMGCQAEKAAPVDTERTIRDTQESECHPEFEIPYDNVDQDCDGQDLRDIDADGYEARLVGGDDCRDTDPNVHPGAKEIPYDHIDQDCDGVDPADLDHDGFEAIEAGGDDCDDQDPAIHPGVEDLPYDGIDQDCDGGDLRDLDGDSFDAVEVGGEDCQDTDPAIYPGAKELPYDGIDQDCDGGDLRDLDGDSFDAVEVGGEDCDDEDPSAFPGNPELLDFVDNDCDGLVDESITLPFQVVVAGNFLGSGDCSSTSSMGCDLYLVDFEDDTWNVTDVERITSASGAAEYFPSIDRRARHVAFDSAVGSTHTLSVLDLDTLATTAIGPGRYPNFAKEHDRLAYSDDDWRIHLASYDELGGLLAILEDDELTDGRDPQFFPDDATLIFHHQPEDEETRTVLYDLDTDLQTDWSDADGCAHATVNHDATLALCQDGSVVHGRAWEDPSWGAYEELLRPSTPSTYGESFEGCDMVWFSYPEFCGGPYLVAIGASCVVRGTVRKTNVILVDLESGEILSLHGLIEEHLGLSDRSSVTIACTPI